MIGKKILRIRVLYLPGCFQPLFRDWARFIQRITPMDYFLALLTGLFGYIAYTDFKADHKVRGWIFSGVAAFFYAGNIYGSAASAQIYNAKIKFDFESEVQNFLEIFGYNRGEL